MAVFLPFIVIGITTGAVYGMAGVGLVLTFKTSGIFNFAYGGLAAIAVFVFYWLHTQHGWPWPYAALLCVVGLGLVEGIALEYLARLLEPASSTIKVVATVGLLLIILGFGTLWYGNSNLSFPSFLDTNTVRILDTNVGFDQIILLVVSLVGTGVLYWFLRSTRLGVTMRGVVDSGTLVSIAGENPIRVRRWSWIIGSMFASLAGLLLAPALSLDVLVITLLVVQAFGAAAIGYFSNLPLTYAGGIAIGIAAALATKYAASFAWLAGLPAGLPFIVLFVVLIVTPKRKLIERKIVNALPVHRPWHAPLNMRLVAALGLLAFLVLVPTFAGTHQIVWSLALADIILLLSLGLLVRDSGQVSLCQLAFAAVGAAAFSHLAVSWHVPWFWAVLLAGAIAVPVGAIVAIPAIRLSGVFLAIATLGFGILLEQMLYTTSFMFSQQTSGIPAPRPDVSIGGWSLHSDRGFYYVLLIFAVVITLITVAIQRGRMGRVLKALADSPSALETHGTSTNVTRVTIFCITAAMAAIAGALTAGVYNFSLGSNYASFNSLTLFTLVIISIGGTPWYAILAAIGYAVVPGYVTNPNVSTYLEIVFGVFAIGFAVQGGNVAEIPRTIRAAIERLAGSRAIPAPLRSLPVGRTAWAAAGAETAGAPASASARPRRLASGLSVDRLTVRFGGVEALRSIHLDAPLGSITGLVGPNGAGKTTLFNACSGLVAPDAGSVYLGGQDVSRLGPAGRSRKGLGRTFQQSALFESLSVAENVELGREASFAGLNPVRHVWGTQRQRNEVADATREAMSVTGIESLSERHCGSLPTGQKRLVELARTVAGPFEFLLLDEPSSGLDSEETKRFGDILQLLVERYGIGILLVEHDMALVNRVCERVFVLEFGEMIFEGTAEEMAQSQAVKVAYLGSESGAASGVDAPPEPKAEAEGELLDL